MRFSEKSSGATCLIAHVDPVDDTGDRLAQSVLRERLVFRTATILWRGGLEGAQSWRGMCTQPDREDVNLAKYLVRLTYSARVHQV